MLQWKLWTLGGLTAIIEKIGMLSAAFNVIWARTVRIAANINDVEYLVLSQDCDQD